MVATDLKEAGAAATFTIIQCVLGSAHTDMPVCVY